MRERPGTATMKKQQRGRRTGPFFPPVPYVYLSSWPLQHTGSSNTTAQRPIHWPRIVLQTRYAISRSERARFIHWRDPSSCWSAPLPPRTHCMIYAALCWVAPAYNADSTPRKRARVPPLSLLLFFCPRDVVYQRRARSHAPYILYMCVYVCTEARARGGLRHGDDEGSTAAAGVVIRCRRPAVISGAADGSSLLLTRGYHSRRRGRGRAPDALLFSINATRRSPVCECVSVCVCAVSLSPHLTSLTVCLSRRSARTQLSSRLICTHCLRLRWLGRLLLGCPPRRHRGGYQSTAARGE